MTDADAEVEPVGLTRVDEGLGLAIDRAGRSGRTLVTYARDHVLVRTPTRPDFRDGNTIDLVEPPAPAALPRWSERFAQTVGILGVEHVQLRWEVPLDPDAPAVAPAPDPELARAASEAGFELAAVTVLLLDELVAPDASPSVELLAVPPPSTEPRLEVARRWHAAEVLLRYQSGETPVEWRANDSGFAAWSIEVQQELAESGRAQVWLAIRHGAPVGRCTLLHDAQGLVAVEDVVVHPVHRRLGIASVLTHAAVANHLRTAPSDRVGLGADPGSSAEHLYRRLGFRPHATLWTASGQRSRPAAAEGPDTAPR